MSSLVSSASVVGALLTQANESVAKGRFARAELLLRSVDALEMTPDSALHLAETLAAWGRHDDAEIEFDSAWERSKASGDVVGQRNVCVALTRYWRDRDDNLRARQYEQLAIRLSMESNEDGNLDGSTLLSVAVGAMLAGGTSRRTVTLSRAAAIADERLKAPAAALEAITQVVDGNTESAGTTLYECYRSHRAAGDRAAAATDLFFIGHVLRLTERYADAAVSYAGAAETWESLGQLCDAKEAARSAHECRRVELATACEAVLN